MLQTLDDDAVIGKSADGLHLQLKNNVVETRRSVDYLRDGKKQYHQLLKSGKTTGKKRDGDLLKIQETQLTCPDGSVVKLLFFPRIPRIGREVYRPLKRTVIYFHSRAYNKIKIL